MTGLSDSTRHSGNLQRINRALARLLYASPAPLALGAEAAERDELVTCGLLGGKDVGKSTLINALAGVPVSVDEEEVGRGTDHPRAYVHQDMRDVVEARLHAIDQHMPLAFTTHTVDGIRNLVLVDLPDFDSEFLDHLQVVRSVAPLLDRILWVLTPRKIGDRAWTDMLGEVIKDPSNVHCVLNKVDELLADSDPFRSEDSSADENGRAADSFWRRQHEWVAQTIQPLGCPTSESHRFLVAAAFPTADRFIQRISVLWDDAQWTRYAEDRSAVEGVARLVQNEIARLRTCVLSPVSRDTGQAIKLANLDRERRVMAKRIRKHHDLDRKLERLAQAVDPDYLGDVLQESFDGPYVTSAAGVIDGRRASDQQLADELLERRIEPWPLLRIVYWPFGWFARLVGKRVGGDRISRFGKAPAEAFAREGKTSSAEVGGPSLLDRTATLRSRFLADHAVLCNDLHLADEVPEAATLADSTETAMRGLPARLDREFIEAIRRADRRPSLFGKLALWLILIWFPFLQPVAQGVLEILAEGGPFHLTRGLYHIVTALSAAHLLMGFAVVGIIYLGLLAAMYARSLRSVRRKRQAGVGEARTIDAVEQTLCSEILMPISNPFRDRLVRLGKLHQQLLDESA